MISVNRAYIASRFGQLHYHIAVPDSATKAPALLCLHQTPGSGKDWLPVLADLGQQRVVVAVDTPGYGMSDPPPAPLDIEEFAAIMVQCMADLGAAHIVPTGQFDVMGMHTGSITATEIARAFPDQVRKAILFGLAAYPSDIRQAKLAGLPKAFPPPGDDLKHIEMLWAIFRKLKDPRISAESSHIAMAECLRLGARMPWGFIAVYRYDFLAALPQLRQPTLVMNPQDDLWTLTQESSRHLPNARRVDMPGVAHGVLTIERVRVLAAINEFLAEA